jgi:hypothetical protein
MPDATFPPRSSAYPLPTQCLIEMAQALVEKAAIEVSSKNTESAQIKTIRGLSAQMRCAMNAYAPEAERKRAFSEFTKAHAVNPAYFSRVIALASSWKSATDHV